MQKKNLYIYQKSVVCKLAYLECNNSYIDMTRRNSSRYQEHFLFFILKKNDLTSTNQFPVHNLLKFNKWPIVHYNK